MCLSGLSCRWEQASFTTAVQWTRTFLSSSAFWFQWAINKFKLVKEAFWQFKYRLEKTCKACYKDRNLFFFNIKKQQAQPTNSCDGGEGLYFVVYPCMGIYWNFTEDFQHSWKSLQNSNSSWDSPLGVLSPAFLKKPGWPVNWLGWRYRLVETLIKLEDKLGWNIKRCINKEFIFIF